MRTYNVQTPTTRQKKIERKSRRQHADVDHVQRSLRSFNRLDDEPVTPKYIYTRLRREIRKAVSPPTARARTRPMKAPWRARTHCRQHPWTQARTGPGGL